MSVRRAVQIGFSAVALALGGLVVVPAPAQAVPPNLIAVGPGCALDSAILSAQLDFSFGTCTAGDSSRRDVIQLPPGTYSGPFVVPSSFAPLEILGQTGEESTTILDGNGTGTTLTVAQDADVQLAHLTITGGHGADGAPAGGTNQPGADGGPGGIDNAGHLDLVNLVVTGNLGGDGSGATIATLEAPGLPGGAGGAGGIANSGALSLGDGTSVSTNTGGDGGDGGHGAAGAACSVHGALGFSCIFVPTAGGTGGAGGAGGVANKGSLQISSTASIGGNQGGAGAAGGGGGRGANGTDGCANGGAGGTGGPGGPGGLYVGDGTQVSGDATVISGNLGAAGGTGGDGATVGCAPAPAGAAGSAGASEIRRGSQTLSWATAPPPTGASGSTFTPSAASTSGLTPVVSVADDCSLGSGTGEVTLTALDGGSCTVNADEAGNAFFLAATTLGATVSIPDASAPDITPNVTGTLGNGGWYTSDVTVTWTVSDSGSDITSSTGCDEVDITADQASTDYTCEATSAGGTDSSTVSIKRDATVPTLTPSVAPSPVVLGGSVAASANATDPTPGSGVDSSTVQCGAVSSSAVGTFTFACSASDLAGNASGNVGASYTVAAPFGSFLTPLPKSTFSKSGSVIPVKFTLRNASGPLSAAASRALAANGQVRVILTQAADGSGTKLATAPCGWDVTNANFICNLKSPKLKSVSNPYYLTVQEAGVGGTAWFKAPSVSGATGAAVNPVPIGFK